MQKFQIENSKKLKLKKNLQKAYLKYVRIHHRKTRLQIF